MSTPRSPNETGSVILVFGATLAVLVFAWLIVNLGFALYALEEMLEGVLWP
jgi:hypothetical protein